MSLLSGFLNKVNKQKDFSSPTDPKGTIYKQVEKRTVSNGDLVKDIGLQIDEPTALINAVTGNSLASRSGLVAGVYIYDINGKPIETGADVRAAFAEPRMGMSIKMLPRDGIEALMKVYSEMPVTSAESCLALDEAAYLARDAAAYGFLRPAHPLHKRWRARFDVLYSLKETTMKMRQEREAKAAEDMMRMADDDAMFELMLAGADGAAAAAQNAAPDVVAPITGISMSGPAAPASSSTIISHTVGSALEAVEAAGLFSSPAGADASEVVDLSTINHHSAAAGVGGGSSASPLPAGAANITTAATDAVLMALLRGEAAPPTAAAAVTSPPPPPPLQAPAVLPADNDQLLALLQQQVLKAGAAAANGLIPTPNSVAAIGAGGSLFAAPPMLPTPAAAVPATVPATTVGSATRASCSPTPPPAGAPAVAVAGSEAASGGHSHSNNGQPTADTSGMTSAQLQLYHQRQQREAEEAAARLNSGHASSHHHHITNLATSAPSNQHSGAAGNGIFGSGPINNNHNHASSSANNAAATSANANVSYRMTPEATYTLSDGSIVRTVIIHRLGPKPAPPTTHADPYDALVQHREAERTRRQTERDERKRAERGGRSGGKSGNNNGRSGGTMRPGDGRGNPDGDRPCRDWLRGEGCVRSACKYRHDEKDREKERDRRGSGGRKRDRSRSRSRSRDRDGRRYGSGRKEEPRSNNHNNGRGNNNGKNNNNNSGGAKNGKGSAAQQAQPANGDSRRRL